MHGEASREREYNYGGRMGKIGGGGELGGTGKHGESVEAWRLMAFPMLL